MTGDFGEDMDQNLLNDIKLYLDEHWKPMVMESVSYEGVSAPMAATLKKRSTALREDKFSKLGPLEEYINKKQSLGFQKRLFKYIDKKGMTDPEVYKKAGLDKRLFSKIRSNAGYHPSKDTVFALCLALELTLEESEDLMEEAGYAFSNFERYDLIIKFFIEQDIYNIVDINIALEEFGEKLIGNF